jgi:hypothetical protein
MSNFSNRFQQQLKQHQQNLIFDSEKSKLPATQPLVEKQILLEAKTHEHKTITQEIFRLHTNEKLLLEPIIHDHKIILQALKKLRRDEQLLQPETHEHKKILQSITELSNSEKLLLQRKKNEHKAMLQERKDLHYIQQQLWTEIRKLKNNNNESNRTLFVKKCPGEDCRGYLNIKLKCGICQKDTCSNCNEIKEETHNCNPDIVSAYKLLKTDSKPCPGCQEYIFKIDGCDQMFCTLCHTAFSWKTGKLEKKIHNPHYFEWIRQTKGVVPRNPEENICQTIADEENYANIVSMNTNAITYNIYIQTLIQLISHTRFTTMLSYSTEKAEEHYENLRILYIRNKISEDVFKKSIYKRQTKTQKNTEIIQILELFITAASDIVFRIEDRLRSTNKLDTTIFIEVENLINHINYCLSDVALVYNSQTSLSLYWRRNK